MLGIVDDNVHDASSDDKDGGELVRRREQRTVDEKGINNKHRASALRDRVGPVSL